MKFGLIGNPIAHSLSPALFRAGYDGRFPYDLIETPDFEQAYERFLREYDGINVTAPFKELAFRKADILSEECRRIGAANLLIKTPEGVKAYNPCFDVTDNELIAGIVTEYGIAHLWGKTLRERAKALIAIAHPDFRAGLAEEYAKRFGEPLN